MKFILSILLMISASAYSKSTVINFNQVLNEDVEKDIKQDEEKFRKATRAPASVTPEKSMPQDENLKIDKNVRQIGPNKW